tara:strand:+ start:473 stop:694 length:222 start_codon:yes stop_codon:yes gene_type:complete
MRTFLVSFTDPDGVAHTKTVEALTAMLAIRLAHQRIVEAPFPLGVKDSLKPGQSRLANSVSVVCTETESGVSK